MQCCTLFSRGPPEVSHVRKHIEGRVIVWGSRVGSAIETSRPGDVKKFRAGRL